MRRFNTAALLLSLIFAISTAEARGPYGSISVGNWKGGAWTSDETGEFTSCSAFSPYKSGITVYVIVGANMTWRLGFSNDTWKLVRNFPLILTFDGQQPFNVSAVVVGPHLVAVDMPDNSTLINQFRKSKTMSVFAEGVLFQFNMSGTAALIPTLVNCVAKTKSVGVANVGDFAVVIPPKPPVKPVVATSAVPTNAPDTKPEKLIDQTGSGFVVSPGGHVVTNQHVVDGCVGDIQANPIEQDKGSEQDQKEEYERLCKYLKRSAQLVWYPFKSFFELAAIEKFTAVLCLVGLFQVWAFIKSERAFVAVSATDFAVSKIWGVKFLPMSVTLSNGGKSTAEIEDIAAVIAHGLPAVPWYGEAAKFAFPPITPTGANTRILKFDNGGETGWPENIADEIKTGKRLFYIYGRVKYRDDFSWSMFASKETGFCFIYTPQSELPPGMSAFQTCPEKAYTYSK